jgi:hypothetical protein
MRERMRIEEKKMDVKRIRLGRRRGIEQKRRRRGEEHK